MKVYYGVDIGTLTTLMHEVSGRVYVVDQQTLFIKNFNFDGKAPGENSVPININYTF